MSRIPDLTIERIRREGAEFEGKTVRLCGWLYNTRSSGKIAFLQLRDGSGIIQCVVVKAEVDESVFEKAKGLTQESSLKVTGTLRKDTRSKIGFELGVTDLEVIHVAEEYPISKKEHGVAFLMDHRHLWLRSRKQVALMRIRSEVIHAIREFFYNRDFVMMDSPIITPSACEGTSTLFEINYFDDKAYLTQSGQLYAEASAMALGRVYCFGPTFRAEKSKTRKHLTEFWMVEPEAAFFDHEDNIALAQDFVAFIVDRVVKRRGYELEELERDVSKLETVKTPFPRITYSEAIQKLQAKGRPIQWGDDFGAEDEALIAEGLDRPIIIERWPTKAKAFYMKRDPENEDLVLAIDMIAPEGYGEIIGGSQREDDHGKLLARIREHNLPEKDFQWYLDLRRFGSVPHSGFGLGIERTLGWIAGIHHIREAIPFPRMLEKIVC